MSIEYDLCPDCGGKVPKGAMRCLHCSRLLRTPEERLSYIERFKASGRSPGKWRLLKPLLVLLLLGAVYYLFSEEIDDFIRRVLNETVRRR